MAKSEKRKVNLGIPKVKLFRLDEIYPAEYNPRIITTDALEGLANSIKEFGCIELIVVNVHKNKNTIISGHQRFKVLQAAGVKESLCVTVDFDEKKEKTANLELNNPSVRGEFAKNIDEYIESLRGEIGNDLILQLRINEIKSEIEDMASNKGKLNYSEQNLRPYKKCHMLLSFSPEMLIEVSKSIEPLLKLPEIECIQSANG